MAVTGTIHSVFVSRKNSESGERLCVPDALAGAKGFFA
jgi:hypothetical protein